MKYARKWAKIMFEDAGRVLEFQRAYSQAFKEAYGQLSLIDVSKMVKQQDPQSSRIQDQDRLLVFVQLDQCPACEPLMNNLMTTVGKRDVQIDIFFIDAKAKKDDGRIRNWAVKHKLNKDKLKARKITLNYNKGELFKITKSLTTPLPIVFKTNQNQTVQLFI
jgi:integrating conjugative element protein (TIGR03759 family)